MNSKQWRQQGYHTIFRPGSDREATVYLFRPMTEVVISTHIDRGSWMQYDDVNGPPWKKWTPADHEAEPYLLALLHLIAAECYCDMGVGTCDFCAGIRSVDLQELEGK